MNEEALRSEIEERYINGDFKTASELCYKQLLAISEPVVGEEASFAGFQPLLKHTCVDSSCSCEHFLSLAAQFMFELRYPPGYIHSFLTTFYGSKPQLPLVCVGLL